MGSAKTAGAGVANIILASHCCELNGACGSHDPVSVFHQSLTAFI